MACLIWIVSCQVRSDDNPTSSRARNFIQVSVYQTDGLISRAAIASLGFGRLLNYRHTTFFEYVYLFIYSSMLKFFLLFLFSLNLQRYPSSVWVGLFFRVVLRIFSITHAIFLPFDYRLFDCLCCGMERKNKGPTSRVREMRKRRAISNDRRRKEGLTRTKRKEGLPLTWPAIGLLCLNLGRTFSSRLLASYNSHRHYVPFDNDVSFSNENNPVLAPNRT